MVDCLQAKLQLPRPVRDYVDRTALMRKMEQSRERLVVFHANMGFGKTMFMAEYALTGGCPVLWYHLDRQDNDSVLFLRYLKEGIRQCFGASGEQAAEEIRDGWTFVAALNSLIGQEEREGFGLLIMLDDFQEIDNEDLYELLDMILKNTSERVRLLLTTKGALPRFVNRYVLEERAIVIGSDMLAFSREETYRLLDSGRHQPMDPEVAEAIYRYTEGWPAGVMFMHLYQRQGRINVDRDQMLRICQEYLVHDYIMYELFRKLPFDIQDFLKKTSVLEYLDSHICNAVAQVRNGAGQLKYLLQENMFVQKAGGGLETYRYHSMFRDFLQSQLTEEEREVLCGRAALCYLSGGQPQQALEYALSAKSVSLVEAVLSGRGFQLLEERRYRLLEEAIGWCRCQGKPVWEGSDILECLIRLYREEAGAREEILKCFSQREEAGEYRQLYERLASLSVEFCCEKKEYHAADSILAAALRQKGIPPERWFEYMGARIYLQTWLGRSHQAMCLYREMAERGRADLRVSSRARLRITGILKCAQELARLWEEGSGTVKEPEESWWLSEPERSLLEGLRQLCQAWRLLETDAGGEAPLWAEGEAGCLAVGGETCPAGQSLASAGGPLPQWLTALDTVIRGLALFRRGAREQGIRLAAEGGRELRHYPWLSWPPGLADKGAVWRLSMLERAGAAGDNAFHLFFHCFGSFRVTVMETGEELHFRTNRAKECLAYLYHMGQPVTREQIIRALWNDVDDLPANEVAALHNMFSSLRKSLSPYGLENVICYEDKKYFLREDCLFSAKEDIDAFLQAAQAGGEELAAASFVCSMYEGSYLGDIGGVWCVEQREYYDKRLCDAFFDLAQVYMREEAWEAALEALRLAEEIDMLREAVSLCVMDCCVSLRDGSMLKGYYRRLKRYYLDITGEEPGEELRKYYQEGLRLCGRAG